MPEAERRRFVRHLQVHWDTYRHRLPPQLNERLENLRRRGKLKVRAGRIEEVVAVDQRRIAVTWRPRGSGATAQLIVDMVVNAMGPNYNIERSTDPLLPFRCAPRVLVSPDALRPGDAHRTFWSLRGCARARQRAAFLCWADVAGRSSRCDRGCGVDPACGAARRASCWALGAVILTGSVALARKGNKSQGTKAAVP